MIAIISTGEIITSFSSMKSYDSFLTSSVQQSNFQTNGALSTTVDGGHFGTIQNSVGDITVSESRKGRNEAVHERGRGGGGRGVARVGRDSERFHPLRRPPRGGSGAGVGSDTAWLLLGADKAEWAGVGWSG